MAQNKGFRSFTGATVEESLLSDYGPDGWYECQNIVNKTPEGKQDLWRTSLYRNYGVTEDAYSALLEKQGGVCAICFSAPVKHKKLGVDHNHTTGKIRGLLCDKCNSAIGKLHESHEMFDRAKGYLAKPGTGKMFSKCSERALTREALMESQHGKCAICDSEAKLYVDHDHKTDEIRGLLCINCNFAVGSFNDSLDLLDKAKEYLSIHE